MQDKFKKLTIIFFLSFIFILPTITILSKDKKVSEIENKILTQFQSPTINSILDKRFMKNFDKYTEDQFPFRENFIKLKNNFSYLIGQREFRNIFISQNKLLEKYQFNKKNINHNLDKIINISNTLNKKNIKSRLIIIPNSIAFYEHELDKYLITDSQKTTLDYINNFCDNNNLNFYTPYNILNKYKNEYIYFNTDHHWTQLGAYISYLDMNNKNLFNTVKIEHSEINNTFISKNNYKINKSETNIDSFIYENYEKVNDSFFGTYYSKTLLDKIKPDSIYSYSNFNNFSIENDFTDKYNTLYDKEKLNTKNKYQYFLHGDPGFSIIYGNNNSNKEILIFKDSYFHNFAPFLTQNYSKIHIVDPRYYQIDLEKYLLENPNIIECMFFYNLHSFNSARI